MEERKNKEKENKGEGNDLEKALKECQKLKDEYLTGWQRARADLLNYKKDELKRVSQFVDYALSELVLKILPVLDSFEKARKELPENLKGNKYLEGFFQIEKQLLSVLKSQGVEKIESLGEKFDPRIHEVVGEVEAKDKEAGVVVEELEKGYRIGEKLLRPAKVKISK